MRITVEDACKQLGLGAYDCALPQNWVDEMVAIDLDPRAHFVWCYDQGSCFGYPRPLTERGKEMLITYNATYVTAYEIPEQVLTI